MEYNKIQNRLQDFINYYERSGEDSIKWNEYRNLEEVYKNNSLVEDFKAIAEYLHKWMHNIGKEVYLSREGWNYTLVDSFSELNHLNQNVFDNNYSTIFTKEMFDKLCVDYVTYQVERLIGRLIEREITSNSTSKINNLVFEWNLECKQELIKIFKKLLDNE